ncbi:MAG: 5-(carboxyamino)imidazole ribonucleotide synthase [Oligoflexia bacterium]|nr:5-(carboxyamino)imidazole ribonucleotide synthase [Oligoflexia bacterium]
MSNAKLLPVKVGILGGGQLARMLALSAYNLGLRPYVFVRSMDECAVEVAAEAFIDDQSVESLAKFYDKVDVLVIENEFVDLALLQAVLGAKPLYPSLDCLQLVQNKLDQKNNLKKYKIPTLDFIPVRSLEDIHKVEEKFGPSFVLKKAQFGYDGRGTFIIQGKDKFDYETFKKDYSSFNGYAEPLAKFKKEIAVIVARSITGETNCYPIIETHQENGMCQWTMIPAGIPKNIVKKAQDIAQKVIKKFEGIGVFGVEMFWLNNGDVVVNEIAPRVHNSGHITMNACTVSQFEQHWRAVLGYSLGDTNLAVKAGAMMNIIGAIQKDQSRITFDKAHAQSWIHWYGKAGATLGRKLGHVNVVGKNSVHALALAKKVRKVIDV